MAITGIERQIMGLLQPLQLCLWRGNGVLNAGAPDVHFSEGALRYHACRQPEDAFIRGYMHKQTSKYALPRSSGRGTQLNRSSFLLFYGGGLLALWVFGNPWSRVNGLLFGNNSFWQIFGVGFLVSLVMPFALVAIAAARGRAIGDSGLFRLPILALLVSSIPFLFGLLSRSGGGGKSASAGLPMSIALTLGLLFAFFPYILHIVCCIRGAKEDNCELK